MTDRNTQSPAEREKLAGPERPVDDPFIWAFIQAVADVDAEHGQKMCEQAQEWPNDPRFAGWLQAFKARFTLRTPPTPAGDELARATWFRLDPSTGEWTGEYCSVKPHDATYFVPMVPARREPRVDDDLNHLLMLLRNAQKNERAIPSARDLLPQVIERLSRLTTPARGGSNEA